MIDQDLQLAATEAFEQRVLKNEYTSVNDGAGSVCMNCNVYCKLIEIRFEFEYDVVVVLVIHFTGMCSTYALGFL